MSAWIATAASRVPLERRIALACSTEVLEHEIPSNVRLPFANAVKLKDVTRAGRALRSLVAQRVVATARPVTDHPTHRRITALIQNPPLSPVSDDERRLLDMVKWVESAGLQPIRENHPLEPNSGTEDGPRSDFNIGIAVMCGNLFFYRSGHHRLAIAKALGIPTVYVDLRLWDTRFNRIDAADQTRILAELGVESLGLLGTT